jgi:hypothetical protein
MRTKAVILLALASRVALGDTTTEHTVMFQDRVGGAQVTTVRDDGRIDVRFSYLDNGRGPDLDEQITIGTDGAPSSYRMSGKSTFGAPVSEAFTRDGVAAEWQSRADSGEKVVAGAAAYVPIESSPEMTAVIARAIARQPERRLGALPSGELELERLAQTVAETSGRRLPVALHAITGVSIRPAFVWLTDDAEQRFFAAVFPGYMTIVERGWEANGAALEQLQVQAEGEWLERLAQRLRRPLPEPILIRNARVFDAEHARLGGTADVYIRNGRIAAIYEAGSAPREVATVIDGDGQVLMPALFDMHSHEDPWNLILQIAAGVTTSRDMGNDNAVLAEISARVNDGKLIGPRIVPAGYIEGTSEFASISGFVVDSVQEAQDAIDWYAQHGYGQIKLYNSIRPEWVAPIAAYAHRRALRVSGHIPAFMRAEEAVRAGYDEIQHINQVVLNFYSGPDVDTRTLARFYLIADNAHELDLDSARVRELVELLRSRGTVVDATLATFEAMFSQKQGEVNPSFAAVAPHVPPALQRSWLQNSMDVTDENVRAYRASYAKLVEFTGRLHRAGVPLVAGTDDIAGFTLQRELELYVAAGIPPAEALRIATWNGAMYTGRLHELGSIAPRKRADLILVRGDPSADVSSLRRISLVMKDGVAYLPAEVYEAVGVRRFADPPPIAEQPTG